MPQPDSAFAQLWPAEQRTLVARAARVPAAGVIVEIGTAQGGSAWLLHEAAGRRGVAIYSFDIAPSGEAYERLRDTDVRIVAKSSVDGARDWERTGGRPIDLLFIDGSHAVEHVLGDFNAWARFLRPDGQVMFHDYDSVERGGLAHLGSYVVLRTILSLGILTAPTHADRLLYGTVGEPERACVTVDECRQTLAGLGRDIVRVRDADYAGWTPVGEPVLGRLLAACLRLDRAGVPVSPERAVSPGRFLVFARPLAQALETLLEHGVAHESLTAINSLYLCYFVANALSRRRDDLLTLAASRGEFFRWEEALFMFHHAFGPGRFPDEIAPQAGSDAGTLSAFVAREQIRLILLARLLEALVGLRP